MFLVYILENITIMKCEYLWQVYCPTSFWCPKWHKYQSHLAGCLWSVTYDSTKLKSMLIGCKGKIFTQFSWILVTGSKNEYWWRGSLLWPQQPTFSYFRKATRLVVINALYILTSASTPHLQQMLANAMLLITVPSSSRTLWLNMLCNDPNHLEKASLYLIQWWNLYQIISHREWCWFWHWNVYFLIPPAIRPFDIRGQHHFNTRYESCWQTILNSNFYLTMANTRYLLPGTVYSLDPTIFNMLQQCLF